MLWDTFRLKRAFSALRFHSSNLLPQTAVSFIVKSRNKNRGAQFFHLVTVMDVTVPEFTSVVPSLMLLLTIFCFTSWDFPPSPLYYFRGFWWHCKQVSIPKAPSVYRQTLTLLPDIPGNRNDGLSSCFVCTMLLRLVREQGRCGWKEKPVVSL